MGEGIASNSWAVSGSKTVTGKPLLANDPHLAPAMPSLWYQAGLHCRSITADCSTTSPAGRCRGCRGLHRSQRRHRLGFTIWVQTSLTSCAEKVTGDNYEIDGKKQPLTTRQEVIKVAGGEDVTITVRSTPNRPIMSDVLESTAAAGTVHRYLRQGRRRTARKLRRRDRATQSPSNGRLSPCGPRSMPST